jgi:hypothetical protein
MPDRFPKRRSRQRERPTFQPVPPRPFGLSGGGEPLPWEIEGRAAPEQEDIGTLRRYLAMGTRGVGGLIGLTPARGLGSGAISELLAEAIEGQGIDPWRVAGSAVTGGFGGAAAASLLRNLGAPLAAATRGAALGAAGPIGRSLVEEGRFPEMGDVALGGAIGGATAGGLAKLLGGRLKMPTDGPPSPHPMFEIETTAQPGGRVATGGKRAAGKYTPGLGRSEQFRGAKLGTAEQPPPIRGTGEALAPGAIPAETQEELRRILGMDLGARGGRVPLVGASALESSRVQKAIAAETKTAEVQQRAAERAADRTFMLQERERKLAEEAEALIELEKTKASLEGPTQSISETIGGRVPGGTARLTSRWTPAAAESAPDVSAATTRARQPRGPHGPPAGPEVTPKAPTGVPSDMAPGVPTVPRGASQADLQAAIEQRLAQQSTAAVPPVPPQVTPVGTQPEGIAAQLQKALTASRGAPAAAPEAAGTVEKLREVLGTVQRQPTAPGIAPIDDAVTTAARIAPETAQVAPGAAEALPEGVSALPFYKGRVAAAGPHYDAVQALFKAGEAPKEGARLAGRALQREAREAGLPTQTPQPPFQGAPPEGPPPPFDPEMRAKLAQAKERLSLSQRPSAVVRSEVGAAPLRAMLGITGAGLGAAVGGATSEDPLTGALTGGAIGGALGYGLPAVAGRVAPLISRLSSNPAEVAEVSATAAHIGTVEGTEKLVSNLWQKLPNYLRANYLLGQGIFANVLAGPYGSAWLGALERALAGDPRGWTVVRNFTPDVLAREFGPAFKEAAYLVGRAERHEGLGMVQSLTPIDKLIAIPGTWMTAGDVIARRQLIIAGFSEQEARLMTLTTDPSWKLLKKLVDLQRHGGPAGQIALPFARTIGNIVERGAERIPGIGFLVNRAKESPDPTKLAAIKQLFGAGSFALGEQVGERVDPENEYARLIRSLTSNIAGQGSLLASAGYAAGQARRAGGELPQMARAAGTEAIQGIPLPTTAPARDWLNFLTTEDRPRRIPRGTVPTFLRDYLEDTYYPQTTKRAGKARKAKRERSR